MQKNIFTIGLILLTGILPVNMLAESRGWQLGVKGGINLYKQAPNDSTGMQSAPIGGIDARYIIHWAAGKNGQIGFITGLDLTYGKCTLSGEFLNDSTRTTEWLDINRVGQKLKYFTSIKGTEQHQFVQASIPLYFSVKGSSFSMAFGPKLQLMVYDRYERNLSQADILASFPELGVNILNDPYTGRFDKKQAVELYGLPLAGLSVGGEIGYEFPLGKVKYMDLTYNRLGIQLFAEWTCINIVKSSIISITPSEIITDPVAVVKYNGFANRTATDWRPLNVGLRIYYNFHTLDYKARGLHQLVW